MFLVAWEALELLQLLKEPLYINVIASGPLCFKVSQMDFNLAILAGGDEKHDGESLVKLMFQLYLECISAGWWLYPP